MDVAREGSLVLRWLVCGFALAACAPSPSRETGSGGDGAVEQPGAPDSGAAPRPPISLEPTNTARMGKPADVSFQRFASTCGIMNPPFKDDDLYSLSINSFEIDGKGPFDIDIALYRTLPLNQDLAFSLSPVDVAGQSADGTGAVTNTWYGQQGVIRRPGGDFVLNWTQGKIDATLLTGPIMVNVSAFPGKDADLVEARFTVTFTDGRLLDFIARAPLFGEWSGCPMIDKPRR
jgi:hypothetical protein